MSISNYRHRGFAPERADELLLELATLLAPPSDAARLGPRKVRSYWTQSFAARGWACDVPVLGSNLSVSFCRDQTAVCVQLGNVARTYADMLKLQTLYKAGVVEHGILVVPEDSLSRALGSNHASYSRLSREIDLFADVIDLPLLAVAVTYE